ncbi:PEP-CTERM sorting domain-containing protein [Desulfobulbus sp.]|uniref:PEP-CTERM sorting domain-containing protein n=1 Tax=Desulfobulbus sp. TaxID=895 RepID=UPI00286EF40E|nr:PEP-CTERM sorting domain-containing protein [Desulfobulbus sp.]
MKMKLFLGVVALFIASQAHALSLSDVTFNGQVADAYTGLVSGNDSTNAANAYFGGGFSQIVKDDNPGSGTDNGVFGGLNFTLSASKGKTGTWDLTWSGANLPATIDFMVVLKAGSNFVGYFFDDIVLDTTSSGSGTWAISFLTKGGQIPDLSHLSLYGRDLNSYTPPTDPVPEPATMLLFGVGLIGLAGFSRRKS